MRAPPLLTYTGTPVHTTLEVTSEAATSSGTSNKHFLTARRILSAFLCCIQSVLNSQSRGSRLPSSRVADILPACHGLILFDKLLQKERASRLHFDEERRWLTSLGTIHHTVRFCLLAFAFLGSFTHSSLADSSSLPPQTEGKKRLLEWDLNKSFALKKGPFSTESGPGNKTFNGNSFATKSFNSKSAQEAPKFYTPEFLTSSGKAASTPSAVLQRFSTGTSPVADAAQGDRKFNSGKPEITPSQATSSNLKNFNGDNKTFPNANRAYGGVEADKLKNAYSPGSAPKGGLSIGHQLTLDEVRDILNRSK